MLLRWKNRQDGGEFGDLDNRLVRPESTGHCDFHVLGGQKFRGHVSQLVERDLLHLGRNAAENAVVNVPGLVDVS